MFYQWPQGSKVGSHCGPYFLSISQGPAAAGVGWTVTLQGLSVMPFLRTEAWANRAVGRGGGRGHQEEHFGLKPRSKMAHLHSTPILLHLPYLSLPIPLPHQSCLAPPHHNGEEGPPEAGKGGTVGNIKAKEAIHLPELDPQKSTLSAAAVGTVLRTLTMKGLLLLTLSSLLCLVSGEHLIHPVRTVCPAPPPSHITHSSGSQASWPQMAEFCAS